jgi:hypothetical protein
VPDEDGPQETLDGFGREGQTADDEGSPAESTDPGDGRVDDARTEENTPAGADDPDAETPDASDPGAATATVGSADGARPDDDQQENQEPEEGEPATPTASWTPDGAPCDACGERVQRRWQDDAGHVCAGCRDW